MALEIISEPTGAPTGSFTPHADQSKHRSAFGQIAGDGKSMGFNGHNLQNGIVSADGRRKLKFAEYKDGKNGSHDVKFNGLTLREYVCTAEDAAEFDAYAAQLSNEKMAGFLKPVTIPNSPTQVGLSKEGSVVQVQVPQTHQY